MLMDKFVQFDMKVKFDVSRYLQCMCHLLSGCAICTNIQLGTNITLIYLIHLSKTCFLSQKPTGYNSSGYSYFSVVDLRHFIGPLFPRRFASKGLVQRIIY